jgi:hypothetical protein
MPRFKPVLLDCGQQARDAAAQPFEVFEKGVEDYVTSVDQALDIQLAEAFARAVSQGWHRLLRRINNQLRPLWHRSLPRPATLAD